MTAIAALVDKGKIYVGGDSAGIAGLNISIRTDEKVFINKEFIMAFTSSFRMGQLLHYKFVPPKQKRNTDDMKYMVVDFIDAVKKLFKDNDFGEKDEGGQFIVGYHGKLYEIQTDFQVACNEVNFAAVGCGAPIVLGSLYSTVGMDPTKRINLALEAASRFNAGVAAPFVVKKL